MTAARRGEWHEWPFAPMEVFRALAHHEVAYVVIGGVAAVLQGSPLPTYEIEIAPAPGSVNAERVAEALAAVGGEPLPAQEVSPVSTWWTPHGHVDLYAAVAGFSAYGPLERRAIVIELEPGLSVRVLGIRDIIRSRLAAGDDRQQSALAEVLRLTHAA